MPLRSPQTWWAGRSPKWRCEWDNHLDTGDFPLPYIIHMTLSIQHHSGATCSYVFIMSSVSMIFLDLHQDCDCRGRLCSVSEPQVGSPSRRKIWPKSSASNISKSWNQHKSTMFFGVTTTYIHYIHFCVFLVSQIRYPDLASCHWYMVRHTKISAISSVILQVTVFQVILYPEFSSITAIRSWMTGSVSFLNDSLSTGILTPGKCAVLMLFETTICISYIQLCRCCVVKPRFHILGLGYTRMWPSSDHAMCQSNPAAIPRDCSGCILALKPSPAQRLSHSASLYEHPQTLADQATEPGRGLLFSQGVPVDPSGLVGWVGQQRKLVRTAPGTEYPRSNLEMPMNIMPLKLLQPLRLKKKNFRKWFNIVHWGGWCHIKDSYWRRAGVDILKWNAWFVPYPRPITYRPYFKAV